MCRTFVVLVVDAVLVMVEPVGGGGISVVGREGNFVLPFCGVISAKIAIASGIAHLLESRIKPSPSSVSSNPFFSFFFFFFGNVYIPRPSPLAPPVRHAGVPLKGWRVGYR